MVKAVPESEEPRQQASSQRWLEIALILLVCFVHGGAPPPQVNESHYLPKAKHYWQPEWCAGDPFLESADAHLTFYWTVGWLTQFLSLETVAWIGRAASWLTFAWSWHRLCGCVTRARFASVLSAALFIWFTGQMNFAGEWVVGGVEGKTFAYPCVFLGLANICRGRWHRAWPWFGLGGAFHVLVGGWAAVAAGAVWLLEARDTRTSLTSMVPSLALAVVLALPGLVPAVTLTANVSAEESREAARIYVFERLAHHLAPLHQAPEEITKCVRRFAVPLLTFLSLWSLLRLAPSPQGRIEGEAATSLDRVCRFAAVSFVICVVGLVWEAVCAGNPGLAASLLRYYWFRLADVGVALAASLLLCYWIAELFRGESKLAPVVFVLVLAMPAWHLCETTLSRWQFPIAPADKKIAGAVAWQDACQWARENSSTEDMFLVPRNSQSLSWYAERRSLVTWKDVPQDAASLGDWFDRYRDVFLVENELGETVPSSSIALLGTQRIGQLASKYKIDYVITREFPPLEFPQAYSNAWYTIYRVSPSAEETPEKND